MNEICVRTNKGVYDSGDVVYGIVYLRVTSPTVGAAVCLRATCVETVSGLTDARSQRLPDVTHLDTGRREIYRSRYDVIPLGKLAIPFRLRLPHELPGSFYYAVSDKGEQRGVQISHRLHAFVAGDEEHLSSVLAIIVVHRTHALHDNLPHEALAFDVDEKCDVPFLFGLPRGHMHFQIRLLSKACTFDGKPRMFMRIKNTSRRKLKEIRIMVVRTVVMSPGSAGADAQSDATLTCTKELMKLCLKELHPPLLASGLDGIVLPLIHMTPDELLAQSSFGSYVKCTFNVHVEVELWDQPLIVRPTAIPLEIHADYNSEWHSQNVPTWRNHCKLVRAQDPEVFWEDILGSEVYGDLLPASLGEVSHS